MLSQFHACSPVFSSLHCRRVVPLHCQENHLVVWLYIEVKWKSSQCPINPFLSSQPLTSLTLRRTLLCPGVPSKAPCLASTLLLLCPHLLISPISNGAFPHLLPLGFCSNVICLVTFPVPISCFIFHHSTYHQLTYPVFYFYNFFICFYNFFTVKINSWD